MNDAPKFRSIQDQHLSGLGEQYLIAYKNNLILNELKEIKPLLKDDAPQYLIDLFCYLADTA